jgi:hypothetical protein
VLHFAGAHAFEPEPGLVHSAQHCQRINKTQNMKWAVAYRPGEGWP